MRRAGFLLLLALAGCLAWLGLYHPLGLRFAMGMWPVPSGTPWTYQLLSGFLASLTVLSLVGGLLSLYHLRNCHHDGCWRLGKHVVNGSPWCNVHKDTVTPQQTENEILQQLLTEVSLLREWFRTGGQP